MATFTDNFALAKPTYGELADVAVINGNMDTIDGIMHSNRTMLAPAFSQTEDYAVGDVVVYEGNLYRFIVPHTAGNWDGTEVEQTTLGEEISTKGGADVTKTASGNPITFDDGASAPLVKCVTAITGSQDLHGYDKPWVGGAGKNKLPLVLADIKSANTSGTWSGNAYTIYNVTFTVNTDNDGNVTSITVNGTASANADFKLASSFTLTAGSYIASNEGSGTSYYGQIENGSTWSNRIVTNTPQTITYSSDGVIYHFYVSNGSSVSNVEIHPMIRLSTETDPTFTPYSNICPITAYTEGEIEVRGKNLFDKTTYTFTSEKYVSLSTGNIGTNSSYACTEAYIPCSNLVGQTITLNQIPGGTQPGMAFYDSSNGYISGGKGDAITVPSNAVYYRFTVPIAYASGDDVQIELGSTATTYEPYTSTTHTTAYPSAIYRGSEDVVNGEVTSDMSLIDLGSLNWQYNSTAKTFYVLLPLSKNYTASQIANAISDHFNVVSNDTLTNDIALDSSFSIHTTGTTANWFNVRWLQYDNAITFKTAVTGFYLAYELATPTTSSVTPTNLPIKSLSGYTHIESSTGDMEVEYITQEFQPLVDLIEIGNGHTYSTSEQIVGKWTNGKDVYEKTIYYATLSCDRNDWAQLEALDAETFISYSATAHMETASGRQIDNNYIRISYYNGYLYHHEPEFGTGMVDLYVTVRYTKPSSNTRSLNLTKSAVEEIPDEIKNAEYEEKPDVNEADDDAPTEVDER